jgi:hypothetical protein
MLTPLTRAMTGSDAEAGASDDDEFDEEFFEQPETAGTMSSRAAIAVNASGRRRGGKWGSTFGEVMTYPGSGGHLRRVGQLGKTALLGNR